MTRRGGFQELHSIPVESEACRDNIVEYYQSQYIGFEVSVTEINSLCIEKPDGEPKREGYIENLWVKYTEDEEKLAKEYEEKYNEGKAILDKLHNQIRNRYSKIEFVDASDNHGGITFLETNQYGRTLIRKLYVNANIFIQHMRRGKEDELL